MFEHTLDASEGWDRRRDCLHSLAKVSTHWRDQVLSSPSLWASIDLADGLHWVKLSLRRSLSATMNIRYRPTTKTEALGDIIEAVGSQAHRWKSMDLLLEPGAKEIVRYLSKPLPILDTITITCEPFFSFTSQLTETLVAGGPNLRSVCLENLRALRWDSGDLSRLYHFSISGTNFSFLQIISIVGSSPQLQTLNLSTMYYDSDDSPSESSPAPQTFPKLVSLRLYQIPCNMASKIIQYINAPNLRTLDISSGAKPQSNTLAAWMGLLDGTGKKDSMMAAMLEQLSSQDTIHIETEEEGMFRIRSSHAYGRLSVEIYSQDVTQGFVESGPKFPFAGISGPVHLSCDGPSPILDAAFLRRFPTLARLTVAGEEQPIPQSSEL